jgi:hypothetical protein
VEQLPVVTEQDSQAALQRLLEAVRSKQYSLVVMDSVPLLAPPMLLPSSRPALAGPSATAAGSLAPRRYPAGAAAASRPLQASLASQGLAALASDKDWSAEWEHAAGWRPLAEPHADPPWMAALLPSRRRTPAASLATASPRTALANPQRSASEQETHGVDFRVRLPSSRRRAHLGSEGPQPGRAMCPDHLSPRRRHRARPLLLPRSVPQFLNSSLPAMMERALQRLAASCGPGLGTTTLLLNSYDSRFEHQQVRPYDCVRLYRTAYDSRTCRPVPCAALSHARLARRKRPAAPLARPQAERGDVRARWARRAIARYAVACVHVLPVQGGGAHVVEVTQADSDGEDGPALYRG